MEMSLTELRNLLDRIIAAEAWDFPLFIWGGPGIGKSAVIKDVCEARGLELCDIRVGHMDVVDFRGVPEIRTQGDRRVTTWAMPDFLPQTEGPGISVLEELPSAPPLVQLPTYQYVWDRRIGEYVLPEKWLIVATGNRLQDRGVYFSLPRPIASRFAMHITINVSQQEWDKWAMAHDINVYVRAYLKFRPNMLNVDPDPKSKEHAFPCPRTWEYVSRLIGMYRNVQELDTTTLSAAIGTAGATEFAGYLRLLHHGLPDLDDVLRHPADAPVPDNVSVLYAVALGLSSRMTSANMDAALTYLNRLPTEFSVMAIYDATERDAKLTQTGAYAKWAVAHGDVLSGSFQ
jgi:hypothetical protein